VEAPQAQMVQEDTADLHPRAAAAAAAATVAAPMAGASLQMRAARAETTPWGQVEALGHLGMVATAEPERTAAVAVARAEMPAVVETEAAAPILPQLREAAVAVAEPAKGSRLPQEPGDSTEPVAQEHQTLVRPVQEQKAFA
jgi:hypothetical protein